MRAVLLTMPLVALACSQRVTPEDEYAERERERLAASAPAEAAAIAVILEWPAGADESVSSGDVVFVFVRPTGAAGGPPLAVKRIPAPSFPLSLSIGPADAMMPGTTFPDRVTVEARLDRDGDASTTGSEDWSARSEPVAPGGETRLVLAPGGPS